jgi:hypothetical protein
MLCKSLMGIGGFRLRVAQRRDFVVFGSRKSQSWAQALDPRAAERKRVVKMGFAQTSAELLRDHRSLDSPIGVPNVISRPAALAGRCVTETSRIFPCSTLIDLLGSDNWNCRSEEVIEAKMRFEGACPSIPSCDVS